MDGLFQGELWVDGIKHGVATGLFFLGVVAVVEKWYNDPMGLNNPFVIRLTVMAAIAGLGGVLLLRLIGEQGVCY